MKNKIELPLPRLLHYTLISSLILLISCISLLAWVPPISRDALVHHLFLPKLYMEHGSIFEIKDFFWSYFPMNLDLLYMIPLLLKNDIVAKYIHFSFALGTTWMIYNYLNRRLNQIYGLLGCLLFLSIPIIIKLSITVYVDLGLIFFSTASLLLILRWIETQYRIQFLNMAGLCCGLAAGTKYNGLLTVFLLTALVPFLHAQTTKSGWQNKIRSLFYSLIFLFLAIITLSPWLVRNYVWTGNPIYPLHQSLFQQNKDSIQQDTSPTVTKNVIEINKYMKSSSPLMQRKIIYGESKLEILLLPIRLFFEGKDDNHQYFDGKLNPALLILPFFAFLFCRKNTLEKREKIALLAFAILYLLFALFQQVARIRYIVPILPSLVILSIFGLNNIVHKIKQLNPSIQQIYLCILILITTSIFAYNGNYLLQQFYIIKPLTYITGQLSRDQYITHYRPEYPMIKLANDSLPADAKILAIFLGNRGYYFDRKVQFDLKDQNSLLCTITKQSQNSTEMSSKLKEASITHLLIRYDLFTDWVQHHLTVEEQNRLNLFFQRQVTLINEENGHGLIQLN